MHSDQPITLILARRDAGAPDFSGPGILEARRELMFESDIESPPEPAGDKDIHAELMEIVGELRKASKTHAGQADRIEELCERMMSDASSPPDDYHGEARELK